MSDQGSGAATPILMQDKVNKKVREYRRQLLLAWERFATDANEANAKELHDTRLRVELFLKETEVLV